MNMVGYIKSILTIPLKLPLLVAPLVLLTSCSGGVITSGPDPLTFCSNWEGVWVGPSTSNTGRSSGRIILVISQEDNCDVTGTAAFQPCKPLTPMGGKANLAGLDITTNDGALNVNSLRPITPITFDQKGVKGNPAPVGHKTTVYYMFSNLSNKPNCPKFDKGEARVTKEG